MPQSSLIIFLLVYIGLHSLLASQGCKAWVRQTWGEQLFRWYRLAYNVFATITLLPLPLLMAWLPDTLLYVVPAPWRWLLVAGQVLAVIGFLAALRQTSMAHFLGIAHVRPETRSSTDTLVTDGMYGYVRHPLYTFGLLVMWLSPVMTVNTCTVYVIFSLYMYLASWHEEQRLAQEFGADYRRYQQQVGRFVPRLTRRSG